MVKTVSPNWFSGRSMSWNLNLFSDPKFLINCGECNNTFKKEVSVVDYPVVKCPYCGALNKLNLVSG
jgi:rRNA maturation endonuclease Nob1